MPAAVPPVREVRAGNVGVIGTPPRVKQQRLRRAITALIPATSLFPGCPLFVPLVEEGWLDHPVTRDDGE
jgi:glutamate racemase